MAVESGLHRAAWQLAWAMDTFRYRNGYRRDNITAWAAVIDGVLVTPPRRLLLDGISMKVALELAEKNGLRVAEREIHCHDLPRASEMLLAGTGFVTGMVMTLIVSRTLSNRLVALRAAQQRVQHGDLDASVVVTRQFDERHPCVLIYP